MEMLDLLRHMIFSTIECTLFLWAIAVPLPRKTDRSSFLILPVYVAIRCILLHSFFIHRAIYESIITGSLLYFYLSRNYKLEKSNAALLSYFFAILVKASSTLFLKLRIFTGLELVLGVQLSYYIAGGIGSVLKACIMCYLRKRMHLLSSMRVHKMQIMVLALNYLALICIRAYGEPNDSLLLAALGSESVVMAVMSSLLLLASLNVVVFSSFLQEQNNLARLQWIMKNQQALYAEHLENDKVLRRISHDLKHYAAAIEGMGDTEHIRAILQGIGEELKPFDLTVYTGHPVLDSILTKKNNEAQKDEIRMQIYVDFSGAGFLADLDVCAIFGNALDNALEACRKIRDPEKRQILVKTMCQDSFVIVHITNYYEAPIEQGLFSTKPDPQDHGLGLQSIKNSVERYNGNVQMEFENGLFSLKILIPYPSNLAV